MARHPLPKGLKLNFHLAAVVSDETGEALEDLVAMTKRSIGSLTREALELMIIQRKAEIRKFRKQRAIEVPETGYEDRIMRSGAE
jgi:hypothetical protein